MFSPYDILLHGDTLTPSENLFQRKNKHIFLQFHASSFSTSIFETSNQRVVQKSWKIQFYMSPFDVLVKFEIMIIFKWIYHFLQDFIFNQKNDKFRLSLYSFVIYSFLHIYFIFHLQYIDKNKYKAIRMRRYLIYPTTDDKHML